MGKYRYALRVAACIAAITAVIIAFTPGLNAGFLLDDFENFEALRRYLAGEISAIAVLTGNASGPLGRPLSMASFLLDARWHGLDARAFLTTNLLLHLATAMVAVWVVFRLHGREWPARAASAAWVAVGVALVWALLPLHVSVVLYAVQRMAILSGLLTLAAVACYIVGRDRLARGQGGWATWWYIAFPLATALAALAKENGILAPMIAAAIEWGWYRRCNTPNESRRRRQFFIAFLAIPAVAVATLLLVRPSTVLAGYELRNFTLGERLLTQPRVLWEYVRHILIPFGPGMGLIHDDFPKSIGLFAPWTTAAAIVGWAVALAAGYRWRRAAPGVLGGLLWFLAAHAMESTILPLELYFEHRNYIASLGILLAAVSAATALAERVPAPSRAFRAVLPVLLAAVPAAFAAATHARASVWGVPEARDAQALEHSPHSPRLRSQLAMASARAGDLPTALDHLAMIETGPVALPPRTLALWRIAAACLAAATPADTSPLQIARESRAARITLHAMVAFELVAQRVEAGECPWPSRNDAIALGEALLAGTQGLEHDHGKWRTRYNLARLRASNGDLEDAVRLAEQAWEDSRWNFGVGVLVFQLHASREDIAACKRTLMQLERTAGAGDHRAAEAMVRFRAFVDARD